MTTLSDLLDVFCLKRNCEDSRQWSIRTNGVFSVSSCYELMRDNGVVNPLWKCLWNLKAPLKVLFPFGLQLRKNYLQLTTSKDEFLSSQTSVSCAFKKKNLSIIFSSIVCT